MATLNEVDPDNIGLTGYSAGAAFALPISYNDARVKALAAVSPPLSMFDFGFLKDCSKPKLLICGSLDDFTPIGLFLEFCHNLPEPREYDSIEGVDHFWWGHESGLASKIATFFTEMLQR